MNKVAIRASAASVPYSGAKTAPDYSLTYGKQALSSDQYTVTFSGDQITPGKQSVTFSGTGKEKNGVRFTGSKTVSYKISGKYDLSGEETIVRLCDPESGQQGTSFPYTRGGTKPVVAVAYKGTALRQGRDFSVAYSDHKMPGTAKVTIKGKGSYAGTQYAFFTVEKRDLADLTVIVPDRKASKKAGDYRKAPLNFVDLSYVNQKPVRGKDYTVSYQLNGEPLSADVSVAAGATVTVTITATKESGRFTGATTASYRITDGTNDLSRAKVTFRRSYRYTGERVEPDESDLTVRLGKSTLGSGKYRIEKCFNNVKNGKARILLVGQDGYVGKKVVTYPIGRLSIAEFWEKVVSN